MLSGASSPDFTDFFGGSPNFELSSHSPSSFSQSLCLSPNNWMTNKLANPISSIAMARTVTKSSVPVPHVISEAPALASLTRSDIFGLVGIGRAWEGTGLDTPPINLGHLDSGLELNFNLFSEGTQFFDASNEDSINLNAFILEDEHDDLANCVPSDLLSYTSVKRETRSVVEQIIDEVKPQDVDLSLPTVVEEVEDTYTELEDQEQDVEQEQEILTISEADLSTLSQWGYYITPLQADQVENCLTQDSSPEIIDVVQHIDVQQVITDKVARPGRKPRESLKAPPPSSVKASAAARAESGIKAPARQRHTSSVTKDTEDYRDKRDRNNASVRKSRDKARQKQEQTEERLEVLSGENERLQNKVDSLEKELAILRGLFRDAGSLPFPG